MLVMVVLAFYRVLFVQTLNFKHTASSSDYLLCLTHIYFKLDYTYFVVDFCLPWFCCMPPVNQLSGYIHCRPYLYDMCDGVRDFTRQRDLY